MTYYGQIRPSWSLPEVRYFLTVLFPDKVGHVLTMGAVQGAKRQQFWLCEGYRRDG